MVFVHLVGTWGCDGHMVRGLPDTTEVSLVVASDSTAAEHAVRYADMQADVQADRHAGVKAEMTTATLPPEIPEEDLGAPAGPAEAGSKEIGQRMGSYALTYYWIAHEKKRRGKRNMRIYDTRCKPIARVSRDFAARLSREGTGKLEDGRVLNVAGPCACDYSPCFFHVTDEKSRFGVGVLERPLSPFRSVAVDPSYVTIGKRLYIPELDGLPMPGPPPWGGFVHDGCVVADDRGGAVQGQQIDFFMVRRVYYQAFHRRHRFKKITVHDGGKYCREQHENQAPVDRNAI